MIRVLISLHDPILSDIVATAFKQFPEMTSYRIPPHRACEMVATGDYDALVLELNKGDDTGGGLVDKIRNIDKKIEILGLVDRSLKDRFNRFKLEHSIFSVFAMPIDPFALAKNISRLESALQKVVSTR